MNKFYKVNNSKYAINHDFFKQIETEEQSYLLGFYVADGNINEKRKTFRIKITEDDKEIITLFKVNIGPDCRVFKYESYNIIGRNNKEYIGKPQLALDINSSILVNSLVNLGYGYNKTYSELSLPSVSNELVKHFIRGFFDGDGSIITWKHVEKNKKDRYRCKFEICNKSKILLEEIKTYFKQHNINININFLKRDNMYRLSTSSKSELLKIYILLYTNSNLFLNRKMIKFKNYVNSEIIQKTTDDRNA